MKENLGCTSGHFIFEHKVLQKKKFHALRKLEKICLVTKVRVYILSRAQRFGEKNIFVTKRMSREILFWSSGLFYVLHKSHKKVFWPNFVQKHKMFDIHPIF